jgi:hypothetical protein
MSIGVNKLHPALKHGGYAATAILPGENPAAFEKLHQALIAELAPTGALEDDIVATIARLVWRKQNLATFRIAEFARRRCSAIQEEKCPSSNYSIPLLGFGEAIDAAELEAAMRAAKEQARKELADTYDLVEIGETATVDCLLKDLDVEERLDTMIDKCLKRLLLLRGLKSISMVSVSTPPQHIPGSTRAA